MREIVVPVAERIAPVIGQPPVQAIARTHAPAWIAPAVTNRAHCPAWSLIRIVQTKADRDKVAQASPAQVIVPATALELIVRVIAPATVLELIARASRVPAALVVSDVRVVPEDQVALEVSAALAVSVVLEITDVPAAQEIMDALVVRETVPTSTTPTGIAGITA